MNVNVRRIAMHWLLLDMAGMALLGIGIGVQLDKLQLLAAQASYPGLGWLLILLGVACMLPLYVQILRIVRQVNREDAQRLPVRQVPEIRLRIEGAIDRKRCLLPGFPVQLVRQLLCRPQPLQQLAVVRLAFEEGDVELPERDESLVVELQAAVAALNEWVRTGEPAHTAEPIKVREGAGPQPILDSNGLAEGGVRTPWVDVPIARTSGLGGEESIMSAIFGSGEPFDAATLSRLYPNGADEYLSRFTAALDAAIRAGFILSADREEILQLAAATYPPLEQAAIR